MKRTDVLFFFASFFIVVAAWIGFNIWHDAVTSTISNDLQIQIIPINPDFDSDTIQKLKTRQNVSPQYELEGAKTEASPTNSPAASPGENSNNGTKP